MTTKTGDAIWISFNPYDHTSDPQELAYRDTLGDGLEEVLGAGAETLAAVVEGLNARNITGPTGHAWTEQSLEQELRRLAW